ncbi:MAG: chromate resistance protein, partial [Deltaproteobacteria bacterium]|nr:chromate resistance protein [Deltaproteobacteria bacterium]
FFPSPGRELAARALKDVEEKVHGLVFPDTPKPSPVTQSGRHYFKRIWATRKPLWADRLASAWLVRRFIDPESTLIWLEKNQECPVTAIGFGFEGAAFANSKSGITFEQLVANFGLQKNAALAKIAALVHYLDTGGTPIAEAAGVETLLLGAQRRSTSTDEQFAESEKTFDLLYDAYSEGPAST